MRLHTEELAGWGWSATSTHDTKRSGDVRALMRASLRNSRRVGAGGYALVRVEMSGIERTGMPDRNMEYLLYQTLVGTYPIAARSPARPTCKRLHAKLKQRTSWTDPNKAFEHALEKFTRFRSNSDAEFCASSKSSLEPAGYSAGRINSLAQTLLKFTVPGVPDIYQGTEVWDLQPRRSRQPPSLYYNQRRTMLADLETRLRR